MSGLLERVKELMKESGITAKQLTKELSISSSSFTDWGKGKGSPSLETVVKFSNYFKVSIDWLVNGKEFQQADVLEYSNQKEETLIVKFRSLTPDLQEKLIVYADGMLAAMPNQESDGEKRLSV